MLGWEHRVFGVKIFTVWPLYLFLPLAPRPTNSQVGQGRGSNAPLLFFRFWVEPDRLLHFPINILLQVHQLCFCIIS